MNAETKTAARLTDEFFHASQARAFASLSPASLSLAWLDWAMHLGASPGKQIELLRLAFDHQRELGQYLVECLKASGDPSTVCVEPPETDRRFSDPAWCKWPYNIMHQSFLVTQNWWEEATSDMRGVSRHHLDQVSFWARQLLDMASPGNQLWTNPVALDRTIQQRGMNLMRGGAYFLEDIVRHQAGMPVAGADKFRVGHDVATTPGKVVMRNGLAELIQYAPSTETVRPEPILLIPAWIMKYYILDLSPHNSLVRYLRDQGYTVYCLSWKNPKDEDAERGMDDYLREGFFAALDTINKIQPGRAVHATGYCLGGTLLAIAAAAMARDGDQRLASISLFTAQVDFSEPGEIGLFIDESQVHMLEAQMQRRGYFSADQMASAFQMLRSYDLLWSHVINVYLLGERRPINDLMAWNADTTRMPARMHSEYLRRLYLNNDLSAGRYPVAGRPVSISDIRLPMFAVGTVTDHVAPWRSVYKLHQLYPGELSFVLTSGGHNAGIVNEPGHPRRHYHIRERRPRDPFLPPDEWLAKADLQQGSWWPAWTQWLAGRSGKAEAPPSPGCSDCPSLGDAPGRYVLEK
ncbi:PHA/PHB synthase family protein [Parapusillimonas granuli]|uniref:Polyhydroxyalkanoic acid synthase n=1 Tax=Parapusillimonas granuli TaxID=380911 RepID=A0A853G2B3_9BURK|nr:alpha/beta fold hydrolase [Parapusillimonas granuli]MBB5214451.1 polyhydroxyalkanoate synthase [Parapusillimonas granuli]MEB2398297.1 alpha/beta fold hydrolase [Alcaligenaceae bacterium]NYT49140.1 polyhydroxyalkanoic acid synthase [Parapusillimonas granuli]